MNAKERLLTCLRWYPKAEKERQMKMYTCLCLWVLFFSRGEWLQENPSYMVKNGIFALTKAPISTDDQFWKSWNNPKYVCHNDKGISNESLLIQKQFRLMSVVSYIAIESSLGMLRWLNFLNEHILFDWDFQRKFSFLI